MQPWDAKAAPEVVCRGYDGGRSAGEGATTAATSTTAPAPASTHGQAAGGGRKSKGRPYNRRPRRRSWRPRRARAPAGQRARAPAGQRARAPAGQRARAPAGQRARARAPAGRRTRAWQGGAQGRGGAAHATAGAGPLEATTPLPRSTGRGRVTGARVGCLAARPETVLSVPIPESNLDRSSGPPGPHQRSTA